MRAIKLAEIQIELFRCWYEWHQFL